MLKTIFLTAIYLISLTSMGFDQNYTEYQELLQNKVKKVGHQTLVNYKEIKKNPQRLERIIKNLSAVTPKEYESWEKLEQLAFLINSYNVFTIKLIIDHYPKKSIKDIGGLFSNPWKKKFFRLLGKKNFLDNIEHNIIRKNFLEPRIHFAVNCASIGCPTLHTHPFVAHKIKEQFSDVTKNFLEDKSKNYYDSSTDTLYLSKIFKWYGDDFQKMKGISYKEFLKPYYKGFNPSSSNTDWLDYDWGLNTLP